VGSITVVEASTEAEASIAVDAASRMTEREDTTSRQARSGFNQRPGLPSAHRTSSPPPKASGTWWLGRDVDARAERPRREMKCRSSTIRAPGFFVASIQVRANDRSAE
jgi:hypothetical protein